MSIESTIMDSTNHGIAMPIAFNLAFKKKILQNDYLINNGIAFEQWTILNKRRELLNSNFNFNEVNVAKLIKLNEILKLKTEVWLKECDKIETEKFGSDCANYNAKYDVDINLFFFAEKLFFNIPEFKNYPIYVGKHILTYLPRYLNIEDRVKNNTNQYLQNSNTLTKEHPLSNFSHCSIFQHLYEYTELAWQDITCIDSYRHEIVVRHQLEKYI